MFSATNFQIAQKQCTGTTEFAQKNIPFFKVRSRRGVGLHKLASPSPLKVFRRSFVFFLQKFFLAHFCDSDSGGNGEGDIHLVHHHCPKMSRTRTQSLHSSPDPAPNGCPPRTYQPSFEHLPLTISNSLHSHFRQSFPEDRKSPLARRRKMFQQTRRVLGRVEDEDTLQLSPYRHHSLVGGIFGV